MVRARVWLVVGLLSLLTLPLLACSPASTPTSTAPTTAETREPVLPGTLERNCWLTQSSVGGNFDNTGLRVGEKAVNFTLQDIHSSKSTLSQLLAEKPVMMIFGSCT